MAVSHCKVHDGNSLAHNIDVISHKKYEGKAPTISRRVIRGSDGGMLMLPFVQSGTKTMRRMRSSLGTVGLLAFGMAAPMAAAVAQDQGACAQIRASCMAAGFIQGAAREGIGLQVHCIIPIMQARAQPSTARKPLPKVSPQLVAECKASNSRAGRMLPPSEAAASPPPANANPPVASGPAVPGQDVVLRPPKSMTSERRSTISALPPEDQPASGPAVPGQDVVLRPPMSMTPERRSMISALPPEEQPETGPAKTLPPQFRRTTIDYPSKEPAGTIIIDTPRTYLYLVLGNSKAIRYGIGVGREGFTWSGAEKVTKMAEWPDWHPPEEMIARQPYLPRFMAGGEGNPLGARALYLGQTLYRIHGTNQPSTIGTFVSSGCIRLTNEDIADLYGRVQLGTRVVVLPGTSPAPAQATLNTRPAAQPRQRSKATAAEKPAATPAPGVPSQAPQAQAAVGKEAASKDTTSAIPAAPAATVSPPNEEE
jgi:lipoprotein-anchoring transpeptidase ErfK/SrfK